MTDAFFDAHQEAHTPSERQRLWIRVLGSLKLPGMLPPLSACSGNLICFLLQNYTSKSLPLLRCGLPHAGVLENHAVSGELCNLITSTLLLYDASSQRTVLAALSVALESEAFLRAFVAALVRLPAPRSRREAYVLLCWSGAVLARLQLPAGRKAAVRLAEVQVRPDTLSPPTDGGPEQLGVKLVHYLHS